MAVQVNVSLDVLKKVRLFCFVFLLVIVGTVVAEYIRTMNYEQTQATIHSVDTKRVSNKTNQGTKTSIITVVSLYYDVGSHRYDGGYRTFFGFMNSEGSKVKVYYSPEDPSELRNAFLIESGICMAVLLALFFFLISYSMKYAK